MGSVAISAEDLSVKRGKVVRRLLSPLLLTDHQAQVKHIGPGRDAYTLGALPIGAIAFAGDQSRGPEGPDQDSTTISQLL